MPVAEYTPQTYVDDDGSGTTGTIINKAVMDTCEAGLADASRQTRVVRLAALTNINIASPGSTIDTLSMTTGDRVLLAGQTTASQNGIYVFATSSTAMTRATDFAAGSKIKSGQVILVTAGGFFSGSSFLVVTDNPTVGTTSISIILNNYAVKFWNALPTTPHDGMEINYVADATNGVVWHLKYRAADASSYKWNYIGGSELIAVQDAVGTTTSSTFGAATSGATLTVPTVPLAGNYDVDVSAGFVATSIANTYVELAVAFDGETIGATHAASTYLTTTAGGAPLQRKRRGTLLVSTAPKIGYNVSGGATASFYRRAVRIVPVRVG